MHPGSTLPRITRSFAILALALAFVASVARGVRADPLPDPNGVWFQRGDWQIPPTLGATLILDPVRDRLVAYGGGLARDEVWTMALPATANWASHLTSGAPPARMNHVAVYDPVRDRMLIFGGLGATNLSDAWALHLSGPLVWDSITSSTPGPVPFPPPVSGAYDPVRDRLIVVRGGTTYVEGLDVWALSLSGNPAWTQLQPSGTAPYDASSLIYDPGLDRLLVIPGSPGTIYTLNLSGPPAWGTLVMAGAQPAPRYEFSATYDPLRAQVVLFGGSATSGYLNDTWDLPISSPQSWTELSPAGALPMPRYGQAAIYDATGDRMFIMGGYGVGVNGYGTLNDTWALSRGNGPRWGQVHTLPDARRDPAMIQDAAGDRLVIFGGNDGSNRNDTWIVPGSGGASDAQWLATAGTPPAPRSATAAVYDPQRHRMLVFGGSGDQGATFNDTWTLSLDDPPTWAPLSVTGTPPSARMGHSMIYDPVNDRVIVFGGVSPPVRLNDAWELSLSGTPTWTQLSPAGTLPTPRYGQGALYDPLRQRMVIFGGFSGSLANEVWTLSLSGAPSWQQIFPTGSAVAGTAPYGRQDVAVIYEPVDDRMIVFGGGLTSGSDAWALGFSGPPAWTRLATSGPLPAPRSTTSGVYDASHGRMLVYGGLSGYETNLQDLWSLVWQTAATSVPHALPVAGLALYGAEPNPALDGRLRLSFALPDAQAARLELIDIGGRRIWSSEVGALGPGSHTVNVAAGSRLAPGVYLARLTRAARTVTAKVAFLR